MKITHAEVPASFYPFSKKRGNTFFKITEFDISNNNNTMIGQKIIKIEDRHFTSSKLITCINELINDSYGSLQFSLHYNVDEDPTDIKGDVNKVEFFLPSNITDKNIVLNSILMNMAIKIETI